MTNAERKERLKFFNENLSRDLKIAMHRSGILEKEMAYCTGLSVSSFYNKISNQGANFNLVEVYLIARELGFTVDYLMERVMKKWEKERKCQKTTS